MSKIFNRGMIFLVFWGEIELIEALLAEENYELTFGALECKDSQSILIILR